MIAAIFVGGPLNGIQRYLEHAPLYYDAYEAAEKPALTFGEVDDIDFSNAPAAVLVHTYKRDNWPVPSDCRDECPGYIYRDMGMNK